MNSEFARSHSSLIPLEDQISAGVPLTAKQKDAMYGFVLDNAGLAKPVYKRDEFRTQYLARPDTDIWSNFVTSVQAAEDKIDEEKWDRLGLTIASIFVGGAAGAAFGASASAGAAVASKGTALLNQPPHIVPPDGASLNYIPETGQAQNVEAFNAFEKNPGDEQKRAVKSDSGNFIFLIGGFVLVVAFFLLRR